MKEFLSHLDSVGKSNILSGLMSGYFKGQKSRWAENYKIIKHYLNKKEKILEVGTYPSFFLATLKRCGYNVEGLDINPEREKSFLKSENLMVRICDIEKDKFPFKNDSFDKIILSEVFEHLYVNPVFTMKEIKRVLKGGGTLILTTPNGYSAKRIYNFIIGHGTSENPFNEFNKINTIGHRGHIREYSIYELKDFLIKSGFTIKRIYYISFNHLRLEKKPILSLFIKSIYFIFPKLRSSLFIVAKN